MEHDILKPLMAMIFLTMAVWLYMYVLRLTYMIKHRVPPQALATPEQKYSVLPAYINYPAYNLSNLFELPVIFYGQCLLVLILDIQSEMIMICSWLFVIFRVIHSLVHCSYNHVKHRFLAYAISSIALWMMSILLLSKIIL
ncbi:MAPEG family protein [Acinetobacter puyangensis]|uniref:MAPEG family protein n=1 Tax=Acinetobacter puyangensis TaxID=1096779 RepID=UPI003A4E0D46